jgi:DNA-binding NtrC family response regulator
MENKILIRLFALDDDEFWRDQIKDALDYADIENYEIFSDHKEFLNEFNEHVHIAIIDHQLSGGKEGFEILDHLKSINPFCYVIIISGNEDPKLMRRYWRKKAFSYLVKTDDNFIGQLMVDVNVAYHEINSILSFYQTQLEKLDKIKLPYDATSRNMGRMA